MIGGRDEIIVTQRGVEALDLAIRTILRLWPDALIEDPERGESFRRYDEIGFAGRNEILVFRDPASADKWEELGPDPSLDGTLIHFLLSEKALTIAIDADPTPEVERFVNGLR